jgi:hypothetical protein
LSSFYYQLLSGFGVASALEEDVQNLAFIVDGAPQPMTLPLDDDHHLIEGPVIIGPRAGPPQIGGNDSAELREPSAEGLLGDNDSAELREPSAEGLLGDVQAALGAHLLDIAEA